MILQRARDVGEEYAVGVFHVREDEVLQIDGLGAVVVGGDPQSAALGHIARLGLEGPEVGVEGDMDTRQGGQIRRADIAELVLAYKRCVARIADDEETLAVGRHEEHRLHVKT